jgi:RNA polymerase sigma factor (TIGR02999 family)
MTAHLQGLAADPLAASQEILPLVYGHLRTVAAAQMSHERDDHTLQPTALVHEALLKVLGGAPIAWQSREHFFNTMARAMRLILIDHARAMVAGSATRIASGDDPLRGGPRRPHALPEAITDPAFHRDPERIAALDEAIAALEQVDQRAARVVIWRFYNGLALEQIAVALDTSLATVKRDWLFARAWLMDRVTATGGAG